MPPGCYHHLRPSDICIAGIRCINFDIDYHRQYPKVLNPALMPNHHSYPELTYQRTEQLTTSVE